MAKNIIGSIFFLAFSAFYFFNVFNIKKMPGSQFEVMTASTFPFYLGLAGMAISLLLLILSLVYKDKDILSMDYLKTLDFKTVIYFVIAMIFYGFTMRSLGFILATTIFLAMGFFILKERNIKRVFLISVGVAVGFYLLLNNLLGVYIDPGMIVDLFTGAQ